jgi:hypothetical protein
MVAKQPRDSNGRWMVSHGTPKAVKSKRTIFIDESGIPKSSKTFIMSATVTDKPEEFAQIARRYPPNTKHSKSPGELKFSTSVDDVRLGVLSDIRTLDPDIYAVILDKEDTVHPQRVIFKDAARQVLTDAVSDERHTYSVIMDHHEEFGAGRGKDICKKVSAETGRDITDCEVIPSRESDGLQANDFITGSIGAKYNSGNESFFRIVKGKASIRRLRKR